ncbi:hypothetical protein A5884_002884 [Enterococcus sp. 7D2_DIV0200]|uniref:hypothetical protein n=1 Tax=Enterococcus sp. 7D2_DIV0200 TaxID=1834187 RepID=UPI000A341FEA|nr:hypothetical protein [Enterococcus sp. 7D2_DIV0200]OTP49684.1 hypothetical protein A5884_002884 [Enterococcus sp. 7D2_DIV0200]
MGKLYIDEKGPQETIVVAKNYKDNRKLNIGDDLMKSYIADMIYLPNDSVETVKQRFKIIKEEYLQKRKNKNQKELKGYVILNKNFQNGVASLKKENAMFYSSLIKILLDVEAINLLFAINKMSLVVDARLTEWLLILEEKRLISSAVLIKYVLTKYCENEASEEVINALFSPEHNNKQVSYMILEDLEKFVIRNKGINRMTTQIS